MVLDGGRPGCRTRGVAQSLLLLDIVCELAECLGAYISSELHRDAGIIQPRLSGARGVAVSLLWSWRGRYRWELVAKWWSSWGYIIRRIISRRYGVLL